MDVAKDAGCLLSYDPNLRLPLWPSPEEARKQILSIWDKADLIKVSDVELEFLTGSDKIDDASALSLWHPNLKLLLVTLGENGSRYYTKVKCLIFNFTYSFCFINLHCITCWLFFYLSLLTYVWFSISLVDVWLVPDDGSV
jgi:sugar/nucleoside kinase (ribokinase family)